MEVEFESSMSEEEVSLLIDEYFTDAMCSYVGIRDIYVDRCSLKEKTKE